MKIGLIAEDSKLPNYALMKVFAYHKSKGDEVDFALPFEPYDIIYRSKIFNFSRPDDGVYFASAGHGLNLQYGGRNIIWSTLTYNYEFFAQGNARLARQGQTGNVQIYYFIASGTIEERVVSALTKKSNEQQKFVELTK